MARSFAAASNEYLEIDTPVITAPPFAVSLWFYKTEAGWHTPLYIGDKDLGNDELWRLLLESAGATAYWVVKASGNQNYASTSVGFSLNTWYHVLAMEIASNSRAILLAGGNKGTNSTSRSPTGVDQTSIARMGGSAPDNYFDGRIAEPAVWDLSAWPGATAADKAAEFERVAVPALAIGYAPSFFPLGLKAYWQLMRDEDQDRVGGYDMTAYNTPSIASHPPQMKYPTPPHIAYAAAAAPPTAAAIAILAHQGVHSQVFGGVTVR